MFDFPKAMPDAWRIFYRQRQPRPIQVAAMPSIIRGKSVLISSPTASGKTEAAFAPLYQRHVTFERQNLSVVYVAPTRALVNDMFERLTMYFGAAAPELVQRYTGDHHQFSSPVGKFVLVSTPEALDSLQLTRPEMLNGVRAVVCDELHFLHGTARGQQLRSVVARLATRAVPPRDPRDVPQTVAMSATVQDVKGVARLWCGSGAEVVSVAGSREIDIRVVDAPRASRAAILAAELAASQYRKILVFANSRNGAHKLAFELRAGLQAARWPVYLHMGILARETREQIETALKREARGVCVATSTLELGIDIGDVDLVVLADPPGSVSSFLQRIGRGNRRSDRCMVWGCAADDFEASLYPALLQCATTGRLDDIHEYWRPSVEFQQILSLAWAGVRSGKPLTLDNLLERSGSPDASAVAEDMRATGALQLVRGAMVPSTRWMDVCDSRRMHSVILGAPGVPLVDLRSGEIVGEAALGGRRGEMLFAGNRVTTIKVSDDFGVYLDGPRSRQARLATLPGTRGKGRGLSRQVVWALAELNGEDPQRWVVKHGRVVTWGGSVYNRLLGAILGQAGHPVGQSDAFGMSGAAAGSPTTPAEVLEVVRASLQRKAVPDKTARTFREPSLFLGELSPEMQRLEARNSLPVEGLLAWLEQCCVNPTQGC